MKKILLNMLLLSTTTSVLAQYSENLKVHNQSASETFHYLETKTQKPLNRATDIADESGYYYNNGYIMTGQTGNFSVDPLKTWPQGAAGNGNETFSQAEQFIPNSGRITLDSVSVLAAALSQPTAEAVLIIQDKNFNYITHTQGTISGFSKYTFHLSSPVAIQDTFIIALAPFSANDSLVVAVTNDYTGTLPYSGNGFFVEYNTADQSFANAYYPGDGGGDWVIWPSYHYTLENVEPSTECLTNPGENVQFTSSNLGLLSNPVWNYNAWAIAQGAPSSQGFYYSDIEVVEDLYNDTLNDVTHAYTFSQTGPYTINVNERVFPWTSATNVVSTTTLELDECVTVSMEEEESTISIYPNPSSDMLYVETKGFEFIEIYGVSGKSILTKELIQNTNQIDVRPLTNGIYIYRLAKANGEQLVGQFSVVH